VEEAFQVKEAGDQVHRAAEEEIHLGAPFLALKAVSASHLVGEVMTYRLGQLEGEGSIQEAKEEVAPQRLEANLKVDPFLQFLGAEGGLHLGCLV
jgi:hypothetical protein